MKKFFLCSLLALGVIACTHDFVEPQTLQEAEELTLLTRSDDGSTTPSNGDGIVLGQKLNNPYSVENMNNTIQGLYGPEDFFDPTHYYVRFLPQDSLDYNILLSDTTLILFDYPLDYEIAQYGDYYHDPSIPEDEITWQYTVVPVNYQFPQMQYEILEECYIPYDDFEPSDYGAEMSSINSNTSINGVSGTNSNMAINIDFAELERQAFINSGNANMLKSKGQTRGLLDKSRTEGWVYVYDTEAYLNPELNASPKYVSDYVPLVGATVVAQVFVKLAEGVTNEMGYVRLNRAILNSLNPHHEIRMGNNNIGVYNFNGKAKISLGKFSCKDIEVCLFRDDNQINNLQYDFGGTPIISSYGWAAATVLNASSEYFDYSRRNNITCSNEYLRILLLGMDVDFGGGAPMLSFGSHFASQSYYQAIIIAMLFPLTTPIAALVSIIMPFITKLLPDICINGTVENSYELRRVTYHELAHASHYSVVGNSFWGHYIDEIVQNWVADIGEVDKKLYGNKNNSPYCGVGEMWARYYEQILLKQHYNQTFDMLYGSSNSSEYKVGEWIRAEALLNVDTRFNLTPADIFISLDSDVNTVEKVRDNLIYCHTDGPDTHNGKVIRFLFDSYYGGIDFVYKFCNTSPMARILKYKYIEESENEGKETINIEKFVDCYSDVVIHKEAQLPLLSISDNIDNVNLAKFASMAVFDTNVMNMSLIEYYPNGPKWNNHFFDSLSWSFVTDTLNLQYAYVYETDY